ncbi:MAG: Dihydroorotate oxidase [Candidatus Saccharibacteria bacterium]|nr:Dihydroorotate oxidase [Candidatus Saccharibacteria bacterium]
MPKYQNTGMPKYDFFGTKVYSPFGIAAGPLPAAKFVGSALGRGFDIVTFKTVRSNTYPCLPGPNVFSLELSKLDPSKTDVPIKTRDGFDFPMSLANSFGIPSFKPSIWQPEIRKSFEMLNQGQALLVAFQGTLSPGSRQKFINDHVKGIGLLSQTGAKVIEINLSCPNEGHSNLLCFDIETSKTIVQKVHKAYPDIKLIVKITYFNDDEHLKLFVKEVGPYVVGITAINTVGANIVNESGAQAFSGSESRSKAGVSGLAVKHLAIDMVKRLKIHRRELNLKFKIIGVGGVQTAQDFHDHRNAGADFVMGLTGVMWNPNLAAEIKASL